VDGFQCEWRGIDRIWEDAVAMTLLSVCVRDDEQWPSLRRRLGLSELEQRAAVVMAPDSLEAMKPHLQSFAEAHSTEGLRTPVVLYRAAGGESTSGSATVFHAVRLVISEILTNAFRHELPFSDADEPITVRLECNTNSRISVPVVTGSIPVAADLRISIGPCMKLHVDEISRSYNGLLSMKDTCSAMGATIKSRSIPIHQRDGEPNILLELPYFERTGELITWTISNVPLFH
jgi:hypothetical protein